MFEIKQDYFQWLCETVHSDGPSQSYGILLKTLHSIPFFAMHERDINRIDDGYRMRDDYQQMYMEGVISDDLYNFSVSVLEVLIGLANRMEDIMYDPDEGDRTFMWFWEMIENLGLETCTDEAFGEKRWITDFVRQKIFKWLNRDFKPNGEGSPFPIYGSCKGSGRDQRKVELIYQMNNYLNTRYPI